MANQEGILIEVPNRNAFFGDALNAEVRAAAVGIFKSLIDIAMQWLFSLHFEHGFSSTAEEDC